MANGSVTAFVGFSAPSPLVGTEPVVKAGSQSGDYGAIPDATVATWTPFTFAPGPASISPLWNLNYNGINYSFAATSMIVNSATPALVDIEGAGIAHITGYDDTLGTWTVRSTPDSGSLSFSFDASTTASGAAVPDGGTTFLLLGMALVAMAAFGKKIGDNSPVPQLSRVARRVSRAVHR